MKSKEVITAVSKASGSGVAALQRAMTLNPLATTTSVQPNAEKLKDGAIQRNSVQVDESMVAYKRNTEKVGVTMRPHKGVQSSGSGAISGDPWSDYVRYQNKIARIYMP